MADKPSPPTQSGACVQSEGHLPSPYAGTCVYQVRPPPEQVSSMISGPLHCDMDSGSVQMPGAFNLNDDDDESDDVSNGSSQVTKRPRSPSLLSSDKILSMDGATDRWGKRRKLPVSAIFIHAGAGYHSTVNERIHLEACSEAARTSMKLLRSGRSAIDAVEAAIKVLEDKEITNAGFGSNLSIDGTVECDATVVDHLGRSGACGAVPNVRNPISLAKVILQSSNKPLSLRRVPPNLLIGDGAKEFAQESGVILVPNEWLVSRNAKDRYIRWQEDLRRAEGKGSLAPVTGDYDQILHIYNHESRQAAHRDHASAILTGTWNEGQPDSPVSPWESGLSLPSPQDAQSPMPSASITPQASPGSPLERGPLSFLGSSTLLPKSIAPKTQSTPKRPQFVSGPSNESLRPDPSTSVPANATGPAPHDGAGSSISQDPNDLNSSIPTSLLPPWVIHRGGKDDSVDKITDTVGAIAIDQNGKIAAGSSSGGIGMKHRGRIGPAALVGIGTAVIPAGEDDQDGVSVAAVTSGTGEHMATTMASQKCAERIFHGTRRGPGGKDVPEDNESVILQCFVVNDFQEHPGVKYSSSAGAIGVMAVKKCPMGYYLYFAHNTDSFALASMGSNDREPACVMSRVNEGGSGVAQGARKIHA